MSLRTTVGSAAISTVGARCLPVRVPVCRAGTGRRTQTGIEPGITGPTKKSAKERKKIWKEKNAAGAMGEV